MTELLGPADVKTAAITFLDASMPSASVAGRVPNPRPTGRYLRVTRAGGQPRNLIQSDPRLLIECWDDDETAAFNGAQLAYALLWAATDSYLSGDVYVTQIVLTEPVNFPDPDTKQPRYQFLATLTTSLTEVSA